MKPALFWRRLGSWLRPGAESPAARGLAALTAGTAGAIRPAGVVSVPVDDARGHSGVVELRTLAGPVGSAPVVDLSSGIPVRFRSALRRHRERAPRRSWRDYEAAGEGRHSEGWYAPASNANSEVRRALSLLRSRSRQLVRDNAYAERILGVLVANLVGEGIRPRANTGNKDLDREVNALWAEWSKRADEFHGLDAYGVQALAVRSWLEGGDSIVRFRLRRLEDGLAVPFQVEVIEGDQLDGSKVEDLPTGGRIVSGVEFDPVNRRAAYWLLPFHPGDSSGGNVFLRDGYGSRAVPASSIIHLFKPLRAGQVRGVPVFAPVAEDLRSLDDYGFAEAVRKRLEACLVAFVIGNTPTDVDPETQEGLAPSVEDEDGNPISEMSPGMVALVRDGKDVRVHTPAASPDFEAYKRTQVREIASGTHTTYEQVSGDLSNVSFASYRVGRIEFFRAMRQLYRLTLIPKLCDPMWIWFVETAQAAGLLPLAGSRRAPNGYPVKWSEPRFESIERDKDANADKLEVRNGTRSLLEVIASTGRDPEQTLEEIRDAFALVDKLGLVLDVDPRRMGAVGAGSAAGGAPAKADDGTGNGSEVDDDEATPAPADGAAIVAAGENVQTTALNGAQIVALSSIVAQVTAGKIAPASAKALIASSFPTFTSAAIATMVDEAAKFEPAPDPAAPAPADDPPDPKKAEATTEP